MLRSLEGWPTGCIAFHNHFDLGCQAHFETMPCTCPCCQKHPSVNGGVSSKCTPAVKTDKAVTICVPSPKEFLKMAATDNSTLRQQTFLHRCTKTGTQSSGDHT